VAAHIELNVLNAHHKILGDLQSIAVFEEICNFIEVAGRGAEARIGSLRGPSRVGKSTLIRKVRAHYPPVVKDGIRSQPIINVKIPGNPTIKVVLTECLESLGAKSLPRDSAPQIVRRLKHYIKACSVRLIVFDEFQHFHNVRGSSRSGLYDTIKTILNDCRCPILAVGVENSIDVICADPQLDGRCIFRRELRPFLPPGGPRNQGGSIRGVPEPTFGEFQNVVLQFFGSYGLKTKTEFLEGEAVVFLHEASKGLYGKLIDIIDSVALDALKQNATIVTVENVRSVIDRMYIDRPSDDLTPIEAAIAEAEKPRKRPQRHKGSHIISAIDESARHR